MREPSDLGEIAQALAVVGMTEEEAGLYLHLLRSGPSKVGELAPYFEVSRGKLYRLLDDLSEKGFVAKTPERPTVYHPVFPEDAFDIGRKQLDQRREHLAAVRESLLGPLRRMHRRVDGPQPTDWNKIEGAERIYEVLQRVVGRSEQSIRVVSNHEMTVSPWLPFVQEAWSAARRRVDEGVTLKCLLGLDASVVEHVPDWVVDGSGQLRLIDLEHPIHFVIADEREVVFWVKADGRQVGTGASVAVHTDALGPVGTHRMLFERLWTQASPPHEPGKDAREQG